MFNVNYLVVSIKTLKGKCTIKKALKKVISSQSGNNNKDFKYKLKKKAPKGHPLKGRVYCKDLPIPLKNPKKLQYYL